MGVIKKLFGRNGGPPPPPPRDVAALTAPFARPAVQLLKASAETRSFFGGLPPLPKGTAWPAKNGAPLAFLACVDLAALAATLPLPWLPTIGRLLFFYDIDQQAWGFDPKDRGSWAVMLVGDDAEASGSAPVPALPRHPMAFRKIDTLPSWERPEIVSLRLTDAEAEALVEATAAAYGDSPRHQSGGFPTTVQGDEMELECQLVSNGLYCGDSTGYQNPRAATLRAGAADWRLLLQLDSDDDLGTMWGDVGTLYFWIREQDARAQRFENTWLVLQCH